MKTYDKYKPSGVDWIGDIPEHWEIKKISRSFQTIGSGTTPTAGELEYYFEGTINWVNTGDLNDGILNSCQKKITKTAFDKFSTLKMYPKETLLIAMYGATIGKVAILNFEACTNQACCALADSNLFLSKYVFYWFLSSKKDIINLSYGGGQPNISQDIIKSLKVPCPTLDEQTAIADYLDEKTAQIDSLIDNKLQLIDLLRRERTVIINKAVTRGINENAKFKPSGIAWLGDIPEDSQILPIKYIVSTKVTDGPHETPPILPEGIPFVSAESVKNGKFDLNFKRGFISKEQDEVYSKKCKPRRNDIFIVKSGSTTGKIAIVDFDDNFNIWSPLALVRTDESKAHFWFIYYALQSDYFQDQIRFSWSFGTQPNIGMNVIENLKIIVPFSIDEQKQAVEFIETAAEKIDATIAKIEQEIKLVQEYRTALIFEVVTGKIKVV